MMTDAEEAPEPMGEEEAPDTETEDASAENEPTAELPKSVLGGQEFKPGDSVTLEVVQITENSVLVKDASGEEQYPEEEAAPAAEPAAEPAPAGGMGGYME